MKYNLISKSLVLTCNWLPYAMAMAELLSENILWGNSSDWNTLVINCLSQITSFVAWVNVMNSASVNESAMMHCFWQLHDALPESIWNTYAAMYPEMECLWSCNAQSASAYPTVPSLLFPTTSFWSLVPFKCFSTHLTAFQWTMPVFSTPRDASPIEQKNCPNVCPFWKIGMVRNNDISKIWKNYIVYYNILDI